MQLKCMVCGKFLRFVVKENTQIAEVIPCSYCLAEERKEGYEEGYGETY